MDKFGDYLFYLLPGPLKKNKRFNQFRIFFKVIGRQFDEMKDIVLRVREESSLLTASPQMLEMFAQERDMYLYPGENVESFRDRLMMKTDIAQLSGTERGILLALVSIGYPNCTIEPLWKIDLERWAEIYISFQMDTEKDDLIDFACIQREVRKTKQAGTLPLYRFYYPISVRTQEKVGDCVLINRIEIAFYNIRYLDGSWTLNGTVLLDAEPDKAQTAILHLVQSKAPEESFCLGFELQNNLHYLDGSWKLNGNKNLNSYIKTEVME